MEHSNYEIIDNNPLRFENAESFSGVPQIEYGVYTQCRKKGEQFSDPWRLCVAEWGNNPARFAEIPLPQKYDVKGFVLSPDHKSFILNLDYFWDRQDNTFIPIGFDYPEVDGRQVTAPYILAFKPK